MKIQYPRTALFVCMLVVTLVSGCALRPLPLPTADPSATSEPSVSSSVAPLVVATDKGSVEGVVEDGITSFKGIPFVAPPVGELRWREPQPAAAWESVRKADAYGKACIQSVDTMIEAGGGDPGPMSEDCLYLNVWTPGADPATKRPVMVWIYGGAYVIGASNLPVYSGVPLAQRGAVVVNFNYRIGQLGFFAHSALEDDRPNGPMNFGLLDQIAALKWVQANIDKFGGDPNNVTIFGESAGGFSVLSLMASPLARGLFAKGIVQSPYGVPEFMRTRAITMGANIADAVGLSGASATLAELRAVPAEKFAQIKEPGTSTSPVPIIGDEVLPQSILETFEKGEEAPVPLIIGANSDETTVAVGFGIDPAKLIDQLGLAKVAVKVLYPKIKDDTQLGRELIRDLVFVAPTQRLAALHSKRAPSWRYFFSYVPAGLREKWSYGVPHGGEIAFVMDTLDLEPTTKDTIDDADRAMGDRVANYWYSFAATGTPTSSGQPAWPNFDARNDKVLEFGETIVVQNNFLKARLDIFSAIYAKVIAAVMAKL